MKWLLCRTDDFSPDAYAAVYHSLSDSRKAHIDTFRHEGARRQSLAGELALRTLLAREGIDDGIERLPSGQPVLAGRSAWVSIAHCEDWVACAVHEKPVGIDIEKRRAVKPGMAQKVCTAEELAWVQEEETRFFEVWTAKEAYFKMKGTGITNFQSVNTLALPRQLHRQGDYLICIITEE